MMPYLGNSVNEQIEVNPLIIFSGTKLEGEG
jgi:hypothetical protein